MLNGCAQTMRLMGHMVMVRGKKVLLRLDLNVPLDASGGVTSDHKIQSSLPVLRLLMQEADQLIVLSHLGRPKNSTYDPALSLKQVLPAINALLDTPLTWAPDWPNYLPEGRFFLAENVRFLAGETQGSADLAKQMASWADAYVMDAFASAHRKHASAYGVASYVPSVFLGPLFLSEWAAISRIIDAAQSPVVSIVGGSKISGKIDLLRSILKRSDCLIVGGGIANTFLAAQGYPMGSSLYEPAWQETALSLLAEAKAAGKTIVLPQDVRVADASGVALCRALSEVSEGDAILDIGPQTALVIRETVLSAHTVYWNGPLGCFERPDFAAGTRALGQAVADSKAVSLAGGGDTVSAIDDAGVVSGITHISTAGGAFLSYLESGSLPMIDFLKQDLMERT